MSFTDFASELDNAMRPGMPNILPKDPQPGASAGGKIIDAQMRDVYKYGSNEIDTWPSGDAKRQIVLTLQTDPDPTIQDDDGLRSVYIKTWGTQKQALATAISNLGLKKASDALAPGGFFTITYKGKEQVQGNKNTFTQNVYEYEIIPATTQEMNQTLQTQAPQAPQASVPRPQAPNQANPWNEPLQAQAPQPVNQAQQVINLAANGMDATTISAALGLPVDQVQQIINNQ